MSNHLAVATVTASLKLMLQEAVGAGSVTVGRPAPPTEGHENVNLFLYQVVPNATLRNAHQPSVRQDGSRSGPAIVALNLHYLFTVSGPTDAFAAEQLLAKVARKLEASSSIPVSIIKTVAADVNALAHTDLQFARDRVHISPLNLSLEEMSKLWSVLLQVPYMLSVAYTCSPVLIETEESGSAGPPVSTVGITTLVLGGPSLVGVAAETGPWMPIVWGIAIVLNGAGLSRGDMQLQFNGQRASLAAATITSERIVLPLTVASFAEELRCGPVLVEAVLPAPAGAPASMARVVDQASFVLRPVITLAANALNGTNLNIAISPMLRAGQQAFLLLDAQTPVTPRSQRIAAAPSAGTTASLVFSLANVPAATYYVQLVVDGVASAPQLDGDPKSPTFRQIIGPRVTLP